MRHPWEAALVATGLLVGLLGCSAESEATPPTPTDPNQPTVAEIRAFVQASTLEVEEMIAAAAQEAVDAGALEGPILGASCTALGGGLTDGVARSTSFDCIAIYEDDGKGSRLGYGYTAVKDWEDGSIQWERD